MKHFANSGSVACRRANGSEWFQVLVHGDAEVGPCAGFGGGSGRAGQA
ncbi:MAG: hypothetical protein RL456_2482 [Pseudomonadota bacterium]|jgi:hypothetical protein